MNFIKIKNIIATSFVALTFFGCSKDEVVNLTPDFALDAISNPSSMAQVEEVLVWWLRCF
jgi:starch-binding outer membrane protein, SusD/RagB family